MTQRAHRAAQAECSVLLTGVTGFLGREILCQLLTESNAHVSCLVRARTAAEARNRLIAALDALFGREAARMLQARVSAVRGDVTLPRLGMTPRRREHVLRRTTHVIHSAASVRFDLPLADARRINGGGTVAMLDFAQEAFRRGRLQRMVYVSTAFVSGRHREPFAEDQLDVGQRFRNTYEQSKFEAELVVHARQQTVPATVVRPSIVIGDSRWGATTTFNVIYWPMRVFADGLLRVAPADPSLPVDVVPVDYVARGTIAALFDGQAGTTYALAAGERASDARVIGALAARAFGVAPPRFVSGVLGGVMVPLVSSALRVGPWRRFGNAARQYLPYFRDGSRFDTRNATGLLGPQGIEPPSTSQLLEPVLEYARSTDFGRDRTAVAARQRDVSRQRRLALTRSLEAQPVG